MTDIEKKDYMVELNIIKNIFRKKAISDNDIEVLKKKLYHLIQISPMNYKLYILLGKTELLAGNNYSAIGYFEEAIARDENSDSRAAYYGLFRVYVNLEQYDHALTYLQAYDSCFKTNFNMAFYFKVLKALTNNNNNNNIYDYSKTNQYINCVHCPADILELYDSAENNFDNCNYNSCINDLESLQKLCVEKKYPLEVSYLIKMVKKVSEIKKNGPAIKKKEVIDKLDSLDSIEDKKSYLINLINTNDKNIYALIKLLKILINEKKYDEAYYWLNHKMDNKAKNDFIKILNALRRTIVEKVDYNNNIDMIYEYMTKADMYISQKNYSAAFGVYFDGYEKLHLPIFLFKLGELNYSLCNIKAAKNFFIKYLDQGTALRKKCYIYLDYISMMEDKRLLSTKYSRFLSQLDYSPSDRKTEIKAENIFMKYVEGNEVAIFDDMSKSFNNYFKEIISSIKSGKIFRIEMINKSKLMPEEFALIEIFAAPYLLDKGAEAIADKYYYNALQFPENERIQSLALQYKKRRWNQKK